MASSGPALGNSSSALAHAPQKSQRGLNKPKCIQCGNVARSRCPYQSCKSCCSKAQNPCHIHVLKANATFPDKPPNSSTSASDQQSNKSNEVSSGNSLRVASLKQLSNNFAQFNNVHIPLRSKKPLTRKEAETINEWRFSKLKEFKERNTEAENEAFDRYMQNISLLEEVFSVTSQSEGVTEDESSMSKTSSATFDDNTGTMTAALKLGLRSNAMRTENNKKRIRELIDEGLSKLKRTDVEDDANDLKDNSELLQSPKLAKIWRSKAEGVSGLIEKINKARNMEDLKSCLELKLEIFSQYPKPSETETEDVEQHKEEPEMDDSDTKKELDYSLPKPLAVSEIDEETLVKIDEHFSSLEQIEDL